MPTRCPLCGDHRRERTVAPYAIGKPSPRLVSSLNSARHRLHRASTRAPPYSMRPLRAFPHAGALSNPHSGLASTEPQRRSPRFPPSRLVQRLPVWRDHVRAQPAREGRHRTTLNRSSHPHRNLKGPELAVLGRTSKASHRPILDCPKTDAKTMPSAGLRLPWSALLLPPVYAPGPESGPAAPQHSLHAYTGLSTWRTRMATSIFSKVAIRNRPNT